MTMGHKSKTLVAKIVDRDGDIRLLIVAWCFLHLEDKYEFDEVVMGRTRASIGSNLHNPKHACNE